MGFPTGSKACLWWILLSVVVVVVTATVDNKSLDGYPHSGNFWPKRMFWQGIRHPPGLYWFLLFIYLAAVLNSLFGSFRSIARHMGTLRCGCKPIFAIFTFVTTLMGVGLLFISAAAANLSDVVQGYFIGMCIIQVIIDALRGIIGCDADNFFVVLFTIAGFQISGAFGIAMLDSYRPLNQLDCAYSFVGVFICILTTVASLDEKTTSKVAGFIGASLQMVFCVLSFLIAYQVADFNMKPNAVFLSTALINFMFVNIAHLVLRSEYRR